MVVIALVSPSFAMPGGLPAVRAEQIGLLVLLPSLMRYWLSDRQARRVDRIDLAFAAIAASFVLSIVAAPIVIPSMGRSFRDAFLVLRVLEYWLLYRVGRGAVDGGWSPHVVDLFGAFALASGAFAFLQFAGGAAFNNAITAFWTGSDHNLAGVVENGRAVGTLGNANLFGVVDGWFILAAWCAFLGVRDASRGRRAFLATALWFGVLGLTLSQSRSAVLSTAGAAALAAVLLLVTMRPWARLIRATVLVATAGVFAVGLSIVMAHSAGSLSGRFDPATIVTDASVVSRNAILRFLFADRGPAAARAAVCDTPGGSSAPGHEPSGGPAPDGSTSTADAGRRTAAIAVASRIQGLYCASGVWPDRLAVAPSPAAPGLEVTTSAAGYQVVARLDRPGPPDGPSLTIGSDPNLLVDPSFESPESGAWWITGGGTVQQVGSGLFGASAARVKLDDGHPLNQYVIYVFDGSSTYTASAWVRSADGTAHRIRLQLEAWFVDGGRTPSIGAADVEVPADGTWTEIVARMDTPPTGSIWVTRVIIVPDHETATIDVDGASLVHSSIPPSFAYLHDADPSELPGPVPSFRQSPVIGVGPMSNTSFGSFDNDYALVLLKFGVLGLAAFVGLFGMSALTGWRTWGFRPSETNLGALALVFAVLSTAVYSLAAGVFFSYQAMALLALWIGLSSRGVARPVEAEVE
jgi:hypothetical protein